jgi:non-canonical purine NTP pyrophosphatase, rdgB/HAM1 family
MAKKLLLATRNQHKKQELAAMLEGLDIEVLTLDDVPELPEVVEDGATFSENARKKALSTARASGYICLADDSGLEVNALNGQPGVYSARFAGPRADDRMNNEKLVAMLREIAPDQRAARFVCVIALADPQGKVQVVEGECPGSITLDAKGSAGFGYDPLFIPDGCQQTFAELGAEEKNRISHRGQALKKALPLIRGFV